MKKIILVTYYKVKTRLRNKLTINIKNMKNKQIIIPVMLLALTAASISPFISAQAATTGANNTNVSTVQKVRSGLSWGKDANKLKNKNKTPKTAAEIAAIKTAQQVKVEAVNAALASSNYDVWVTAIAALNKKENSNGNANTITQKITRENFPKLVEAYNLEKQLQAKLAELGINNGNGAEMGGGIGFALGSK